MAKFRIRVSDSERGVRLEIKTVDFHVTAKDHLNIPHTHAERCFALLNQIFTENHRGRTLAQTEEDKFDS